MAVLLSGEMSDAWFLQRVVSAQGPVKCQNRPARRKCDYSLTTHPIFPSFEQIVVNIWYYMRANLQRLGPGIERAVSGGQKSTQGRANDCILGVIV